MGYFRMCHKCDICAAQSFHHSHIVLFSENINTALYARLWRLCGGNEYSKFNVQQPRPLYPEISISITRDTDRLNVKGIETPIITTSPSLFWESVTTKHGEITVDTILNVSMPIKYRIQAVSIMLRDFRPSNVGKTNL